MNRTRSIRRANLVGLPLTDIAGDSAEDEISADLRECIRACAACIEAWEESAERMLEEEPDPDNLSNALHSDLDCAAACELALGTLLRFTGYDNRITRTILDCCATVATASAQELERIGIPDPTQLTCAITCRRVERACRELSGTLANA